MTHLKCMIERGSVSYSEHFELTFVCGAGKTYFDEIWGVTRINYMFMKNIIAELEHDPNTLCSFEQRLQDSSNSRDIIVELDNDPNNLCSIEQRLKDSILCSIGGNSMSELPSINVTLDEGCCSLLPHGMWKGVNITLNDRYPTILRFCVRKKVQLRSLLELSSIVVAECLLLESDCNLLEIPQDLMSDIRSGFRSCWTPRSHQVNMHSGSCQLCEEHVQCTSCICSS